MRHLNMMKVLALSFCLFVATGAGTAQSGAPAPRHGAAGGVPNF